MRSYAGYFLKAMQSDQLFTQALEGILESSTSTKIDRLVIEIPPPVGMTSAGLTGLSFLLMSTISAMHATGSIGSVDLLSPHQVSNWQKRNFCKDASRSMIAEVLSSTHDLPITEQVKSDEDVATAYLFWVMDLMGQLPVTSFL